MNKKSSRSEQERVACSPSNQTALMTGPEPSCRYPFEGSGVDVNVKETVFLKNVIKRSNIIVGDYSYYNAPDAEDFENKNVLYHYPFSKEKLIIGKFCAIATGAKFIMSSANHKMDGFSSFPFFIFKHGWEKGFDMASLPYKGDTVVGNDVWIGYDATIMPGVTIGDGAIIGAKAVVTKNVPPYTIVGGNPAKVIRARFDGKTVAELQAIAWWNWSREKISRNIPAIIGADLNVLKNAR
jgi:virginiamycin A acetyltransferase